MRRSIGLVWLAGPVLGGLLLTSLSMALAAPKEYADGNDTFGRLDVRTVGFTADPNPPTWTIHTFASWTARDIRDKGFLVVLLDTRGDADEDYVALARSNGRDLVGRLFRRRPRRPDALVGRITVRKIGPDGVIMSVGRRSRGAGAPTTLALAFTVPFAFAEPQPHAQRDRFPDPVTRTARRCLAAVSMPPRWRCQGARKLPRARR